MKVYVSEKDTIEKGGEYYLKTDTAIYINSLEQHEAEIRKPLLDEIEKIKSTRMPAFIPDGVALHYKQENAVINKAKQEVINELLEWVETNEDKCYASGLKEIKSDDLKQKLNQMKGE